MIPAARRNLVTLVLLGLVAAVAAHLLMLLDAGSHPDAAPHAAAAQETPAGAHAGASDEGHGDHVAHLMAASCLVTLLVAPAAEGLRRASGRVGHVTVSQPGAPALLASLLGQGADPPHSLVARHVLLRI